MESNQLNSPKVFSHKGQGKDTHFQGQMQAGFYTTNPDLFPAIVEPSNPKGNE